ncbi:hypothetical protein [Hafnia alvei]|uniref:hypothetical protein n=1 Tax=Hafnia alvei TaxID=569 RepID=UPI00214AB378|nr:hypothetical protein [Hafnia alvei]
MRAGSSLSAARVAAQWLRQQTGREIQVLASTDIVVKPELYLTNRPTLLVSVTSSGSTPESVAVFEHAERLIDDCYHLIIANDRRVNCLSVVNSIPKRFIFQRLTEPKMVLSRQPPNSHCPSGICYLFFCRSTGILPNAR